MITGAHTKNCDLRTAGKKNLMKYEIYSYFSIFVSNNIFVAPEARNTERKQLKWVFSH
jgi:hypothetical protein